MWRVLFVLYAGVFLNITAGGKNSSDDHQALVELYQEFQKFRRPVVIDGVPDYSPPAIQAKEKGLESFRKLSMPGTWALPTKPFLRSGK